MNNNMPPSDTKQQVTQSQLDKYNASLPPHLKAELWEMEKVVVSLATYPIANRTPKIVIRDRNYMKKYSGDPNYSGPLSEEQWKEIFRSSRKNPPIKE